MNHDQSIYMPSYFLNPKVDILGKGFVHRYLPTIAFFAIYIVLFYIYAFFHQERSLYSYCDGQFFAWHGKFLAEWSHPWTMHAMNPYQGMVSSFLPYSSWFNPGALILALPFDEKITYILSHIVYLLEVYISIYYLSKILGLNRIQSLLSAQLYIFIFFPPFSHFFSGLPLISIGPLWAHLVAICNFIIVLYCRLGEGKFSQNIARFILILLLVIDFFLSSSFHVITFAPAYGILAFSLFYYVPTKRAILWKISLSLTMIACIFALKLPEYYTNMSMYLARHFFANTQGFFNFLLPVKWQMHDFCHPCHYLTNLTSLFCKGNPYLIPYFLNLSFLGAIISIICLFKYRSLAICFCFLACLPDIVFFLKKNNAISGSFANTMPVYNIHAIKTFYCIFFTLFVSYVSRFFSTLCVNLRIKHFMSELIPYSLYILPIVLLILLPQHEIYDSRPLSTTPIIEYLNKNISLSPNDTFKGTAGTFFASQGSQIREMIRTNKQDQSFYPNDYIMARELLKTWYGNHHMFSDIWYYKIPTLEEYAQSVNIAMMAFFQNMLANPNDKFQSIFLNIYKLDIQTLAALGVRYIISDKTLSDKNGMVHLIEQEHLDKQKIAYNTVKLCKELFNKFQIDLEKVGKPEFNTITEEQFIKMFETKLMQMNASYEKENNKAMSGLKMSFDYVKTVQQLVTSDKYFEPVKLVFFNYLYAMVQGPNLHLYEISNPNLANYSPTKIVFADSAKDMFMRMKQNNFKFDHNIIVETKKMQKYDFVPVTKSKLSFGVNSATIQAESEGWSLLLLPMQYSNCLKVKQHSDQNVQIFRANLIQTGLLFNKHVDADIQFEFEHGFDTHCRALDIADMKKLKILEVLKPM